MNVYFISGLGADERVFQRLNLSEPLKVHHIPWPDHAPDDTITSYTLKISRFIDTSKDFAVIGLSFGGMIATELTKVLNPKHTIIISSVSTYQEIPFIFRLCGSLKLEKLVPAAILNKIYPFTHWFTGLRTRADQNLIQDVIHDTNPGFLKWAITEILNWKNITRPANLWHIHGSSDKLFPLRLVKADSIIKNGGHFMILTDADRISSIIQSRFDGNLFEKSKQSIENDKQK